MTRTDGRYKEAGVLSFGPLVQFRTLDGDKEIYLAAATQRGQTLSAYIRDSVMAAALADLGCDTRADAHRKVKRRKPV